MISHLFPEIIFAAMAKIMPTKILASNGGSPANEMYLHGKAKGGRASVRKDKAKAAGAAQIEIFFPVSAPKSPMSFDRDWRRHCTSRELKLQYLRLCGAENIRKIFKTEIDVALLGKIIQNRPKPPRGNPRSLPKSRF